MANAKGGVGIKIAGSGRGHHLSGEKSKIETWKDRLIATKDTPLFARSEMDQTWTHAMYHVNLPLNFYWGALTGLQNGQSVWDVTKSAVDGEGGEKYLLCRSQARSENEKAMLERQMNRLTECFAPDGNGKVAEMS